MYTTMEEVNWLCILLCLPLLLVTFSESCLDGIIEPLISGSRYNVSDQFFAADSVDDKYTPEEARLDGISWCSSDSLPTSSKPWLQVTFEMDVYISIIQTAGFRGFYNYYVTRFEVHIGDGTEGSLHPLTISDDSMETMVFMRTSDHNIEDTVLPSPVITRVLRIVAVEWTQDQVCLNIEALGCLPSPASSIIPATEPQPEASLYTTPVTPPVKDIFEEMPPQSNPGQSRAATVGGAVGGTLFLLVALLFLAIVVAYIFIFIRRRSAQVQLSETCQDTAEHDFDNSIYGKEEDLPSVNNDTPEQTFDNSLYGEGEEFNTEYHHLTRPDNPSSPSNVYESVSSTPAIVFQHLNGTVDLLGQQKPLYGNLNT